MANYQIGLTIASSVGSALAGIKGVSSAMAELNKKSENVNARIANLGEKQSSAGGQLFKEAAVAGAAFSALAFPAIQFEREMANVNKTVDFINQQDFDGFKSELLSLGHDIPVSISGLTEIAASAGQAGVAKEDIIEFTETIAKMASAFEMAEEKAGDLAVKISNVYSIPTNKFSDFGDVVNKLSATSPAKPEEIMEGMMGFGGGAIGYGLNFEEAAMLSTAGLSIGKSSAEVSTGFSNFFMRMNNMEGQNQQFKDALARIGVPIESIREGQEIDPLQSVIDFLGHLSQFDQATQTQTLVDMFGQNSSTEMFMQLSKTIPLLQKQRDIIRETNADGSKSYLGSMEGEYKLVAETTLNQLQSLKNDLHIVAITIGDVLVPPLKALIGEIRPVIQGFTDWAKANPAIIKNASTIIGAVVGIRLSFLALKFASFALFGNSLKLFVGLRKGWGIVQIGIGIIGKLSGVLRVALLGGIKLVANALLWLGRAAMMNPIGAIITGIAVAALLVFKYWEPIKAFFINVWNTVKTAFDGGISEVSRLIVDWSPLGLFHKAFAGVMSWFGIDIPSSFTDFGSMMIGDFIDAVLTTWDGTKAFFTDIINFIKNPFNALPVDMQSFGVDIIDGFVGGAKAIWEGAKGFFTSIVDFIKNPFGILTPEMQVIGGNIISSLLGGAQSLWEGTKNFFNDVAGFIQDPFGTIKDTFSGYGENIMDGIVGGVSSKLAAAKETITNVGNSIKGWFTSVLGIHSPSRVFMGYGENITEGAAIGIENGLPQAKKAIDNLSDELTLNSHMDQTPVNNSNDKSSKIKPTSSQQVSSVTQYFEFKPTIHISGDASKQEFKEALTATYKDFKEFMRRYNKENGRRSYT